MAILNPAEYQNLPAAFFSDLEPESFENPAIYALNKGLAKEIGINPDWLKTPDGLSVLSGGSSPTLAMAYAGHQFGQWSGLLGDGRARLVGDVRGIDGLLRELHLKGSGQTPYSRRGDGKATLGSAIREYIVSEAMAALGVNTTRALSIVTTGENIMRNGMEPGAILCRSARSHIRVGTFQYAAAIEEERGVEALADFAIERLYPDAPASGPQRYIYFLRKIAQGQADLIASWMGFGFIHGVMNTDNMCVSGETIDYGPCAFMDEFHPGKTFSSIDRNGRYAWGRQPEMGHWNLSVLAGTLLPLLGTDEESGQSAAETVLNDYVSHFQAAFQGVMARKLGIANNHPDLKEFTSDTINAMTEGKVDFTFFFHALTNVANGENDKLIIEQFENNETGDNWTESWKAMTKFSNGIPTPAIEIMRSANPVLIARNHQVEKAIADANSGNSKTFERLVLALGDPSSDASDIADLQQPPDADEIVHQTFCGT